MFTNEPIDSVVSDVLYLKEISGIFRQARLN